MDHVHFSIIKTLLELNDKRCKGLFLWCYEQFTVNHDRDKAPFMVSLVNDIVDEEYDDENSKELQQIEEKVPSINDNIQQD